MHSSIIHISASVHRLLIRENLLVWVSLLLLTTKNSTREKDLEDDVCLDFSTFQVISACLSESSYHRMTINW